MAALWTLCNSLLMAGYALPWCDPLWATRPLDEQFRYAPLYHSPWYGCIATCSCHVGTDVKATNVDFLRSL